MKTWREILEASSALEHAPPIPPHPPKPTAATNIGGNGGIGGGKSEAEEPSAPRGAPDIDAFVERVEILESDAGLAREEAEAAAAREQGYADAFAYADAVVADWQREIEAATAPSGVAAHWEELKRIAIGFLAGPLALDAARAGWLGKALFGVILDGAGQCRAMGAVFRQVQEGPLFAFDSEVALFRHDDGSWHPRYITEFDTTETVLIWEAARPG